MNRGRVFCSSTPAHLSLRVFGHAWTENTSPVRLVALVNRGHDDIAGHIDEVEEAAQERLSVNHHRQHACRCAQVCGDNQTADEDGSRLVWRAKRKEQDEQADDNNSGGRHFHAGDKREHQRDEHEQETVAVEIDLGKHGHDARKARGPSRSARRNSGC